MGLGLFLTGEKGGILFFFAKKGGTSIFVFSLMKKGSHDLLFEMKWGAATFFTEE